jgi:hypothetical protein
VLLCVEKELVLCRVAYSHRKNTGVRVRNTEVNTARLWGVRVRNTEINTARLWAKWLSRDI